MHSRLLRGTVNLRHQRPAHAAPGMFARHKKRVDAARRLQVGKAFNAMQPSTSATHGRLARKRSAHYAASYSSSAQAYNWAVV